MFKRNSLPRDFTLLRKFLTPGSKVYLDKCNDTYVAVFTGETFRHGHLSFTSPSGFSRYVTSQYNTQAQHPSGWEVIYTLNDGTHKTIKNIYDDGVKKVFLK